MKAFVTVIGKDRIGITANVCTLLAQHSANVLNISQSIMQDNFVMIMLVDLAACTASFDQLSEELEVSGREMALSIRIQREDIFNAMHRI